MVKFDGGQLAALISRKRVLNGLNILFFLVIVIEALIVSALSHEADGNWGLYISLYAQIGVFVVLYVLFLIFFVRVCGEKINYAICSAVAGAFLSRGEFLHGDGRAAFAVSYEGDILTVTRTDVTGEIIINPLAGGLNAANGRGKIEFDLTALKSLPSVYSATGTKILEFLQAYYCTRAEGEYERVTVCDQTGKTPLELTVIEGGKPKGNCAKNYYVKKGLVK